MIALPLAARKIPFVIVPHSTVIRRGFGPSVNCQLKL
jgi:hypothetical protein